MPLRIVDPKEGKLEHLPTSSLAPLAEGCPEDVKSPSLLCEAHKQIKWLPAAFGEGLRQNADGYTQCLR